MAWRGTAWLSEIVGSVHAHMHYACASLVQNAVSCSLLVWSLASRCSCVSSDLLRLSCSLRICSLVSRCFHLTLAFRRLCCSLARWSLASRSACVSCVLHCLRWSLSRSSLAVCCAGVSSAFCLPITTTTHCTVHDHTHEHGMVQQHGRSSVGGITCSRRPR